jgi:hypothetical protein
VTGLDILIILWAVCAIVGAVIADSKGRNPFLWAVLCLVFGLVGILVISVLPNEKPAVQPHPVFTRSPNAVRPNAVTPTIATTPSATVTSDLQQLSSMHERGALSDEEFAAAKARVLDGSVSGPVTQAATPAVPAEDPDSVRCECGTKNRRNRPTCWSCNAELPAMAGTTD